MIGILSFLSPRYAQFIYKYTSILDENNIEYEVIYWNRENMDYGLDKRWICYSNPVNTFQPFYKKINHFFGFTWFMYKTILSKKYDKLIILTTQTAIPLFPLLLTKFKWKYIYDYRDVTYENIGFYKLIVNELVKKSYFTAVSSLGFLQTGYLDTSPKYLLSHNTREFELKNVEKIQDDKIRIVYWGMVRQPQFNIALCDYFSKYDNIELFYHGAGFHEEIKQYCKAKGYKNIHFTGRYTLNEIERFTQNTDFILNVYDNDKQQKPAMTVKFYDSVMYQIPMIVNKGSYMGRIVTENKLGIEFDYENDDINELLSKFDWKSYIKNNSKVFQSIKKDDAIFEEKLLEFVR